MTNQITITKSIPSSSYYTGSGSVTITLKAEEITMNSKKSLIKTPVPQSPSSQLNSGSDIPKSYIMDLKKTEEAIKIRGWLEDDGTTSAWTKAWQLRSMCVSGNVGGDKGALSSLVIDNITMSSATQTAYLEEVSWIARPVGVADLLSTQSGKGNARIEINLAFYLGDAR